MALSFFDTIITKENILRKLIALRCKEAEKIQKKKDVENLASGVRNDSAPKPEIYALFPPRRQWTRLGEEKRMKVLTQAHRNEKSLYYTVLREQDSMSDHPEWFTRLECFIEDVIRSIKSGSFLFSKPAVTLIEKKYIRGKYIEARPICSFPKLRDRLIASVVNRALTRLFDSYFYEHSYAFRTKKRGDASLPHLNAVRKIKEFRQSHKGDLWVAECDMQKFYDTLDHDVVKQRFTQLLHRSYQDGKIEKNEYRILRNIMFSYIDCLNFYNDIYQLNKRQYDDVCKRLRNTYHNKEEVKVGWIFEEIERKRAKLEWPYRTPNHEKYFLGVPQGGALSGLVANVVMHFTDMRLRKYYDNNRDFLYIRFCDDMIMVGTDKGLVSSAFQDYFASIQDSHLYPHTAKAQIPDPNNRKSFWDGKSRIPYRWGMPPSEYSFPWITFVGYQFNWSGDTRVRRDSLKKECRKQFDKCHEVLSLFTGIKSSSPRRSRRFIYRSVLKRLVGMSVGRVPLWDYQNFENEYSWAMAFTELTDNRWASSQLRSLDHHRQLMLRRLDKGLSKLGYGDIEKNEMPSRKNDTILYFGKPYSYYGQVLKKF